MTKIVVASRQAWKLRRRSAILYYSWRNRSVFYMSNDRVSICMYPALASPRAYIVSRKNPSFMLV